VHLSFVYSVHFRANGTGEDTAKSVETALISGWHHFRDVEDELLEHRPDGVIFKVHDGVEDLENGVEDEPVKVKGTLKLLAISVALGHPFTRCTPTIISPLFALF
jgi:hypothetical protein